MLVTTSGPIDLDRLDLDAIRAGALRDPRTKGGAVGVSGAGAPW